METKPRRVRAIITRVVKERAIVELERDGTFREYIDFIDEIDSEVTDIHDITSVITDW